MIDYIPQKGDMMIGDTIFTFIVPVNTSQPIIRTDHEQMFEQSKQSDEIATAMVITTAIL